MHVHFLQHVPFEGPGSIATWLGARHATSSTTDPGAGGRFPAPTAFDWLIVLGGPMSANDEALHPWLPAEKRFIREAVNAGKTVLGICLGAQVLAAALGAAVRRNAAPEVGWFPIEPVPGADRSVFGSLFPAPVEAFHWHSETFDLPPGAVRLAHSAACSQQAFGLGDRVLGLQCHFETTPDAVRMLIDYCGDELTPGRGVQPASELVRIPHRFDQINRVMDAVLDRLAAAG